MHKYYYEDSITPNVGRNKKIKIGHASPTPTLTLGVSVGVGDEGVFQDFFGAYCLH